MFFNSPRVDSVFSRENWFSPSADLSLATQEFSSVTVLSRSTLSKPQLKPPLKSQLRHLLRNPLKNQSLQKNQSSPKSQNQSLKNQSSRRYQLWLQKSRKKQMPQNCQLLLLRSQLKNQLPRNVLCAPPFTWNV